MASWLLLAAATLGSAGAALPSGLLVDYKASPSMGVSAQPTFSQSGVYCT